MATTVSVRRESAVPVSARAVLAEIAPVDPRIVDVPTGQSAAAPNVVSTQITHHNNIVHI